MYPKLMILGAIFSTALAGQISTAELTASARALRQTSTAGADAKAKAETLLSEAQRLLASGAGGEARRRVANAVALLKNETWDAKQEFAWSLALRPDGVVSDSALPLIARISQSYSAPYRAVNGLKVRASLLADRKEQEGKPSRKIGLFDMASRDLIEQPYGFDGDLDGVADGAYVLKAEVLDGSDTVTTLEAPVQIVKGIATDRAAVEKRLAKVQGHDSTKASVRYPWVLAETVNVGRRQLSPADFGLPFQPQLPYDFASGVRDSAELLKRVKIRCGAQKATTKGTTGSKRRAR